MRRWTERRILFWFGPVLLLLLINSMIAYRTIRVLNANSQREIQTMAVLLQLEGVASTVKDAETGQRGYLLTGDTAYLAPYNSAIGSLDLQISGLRGLLSENAVQLQQLEQLEAQVQAKRAELQRTIDLRRTQGFEAAIAVVRTNSGKQSMDALRGTIAQMERTEQQALQDRVVESQRNLQATLGTLAFATLLSVTLLIGIGLVVYRDIAARRRAAEELSRQREWFEVTLASIGDAVIATDVSSTVTFMNSVAEELTGWQREDAIGKPAHEVFHIINEQTRTHVESPIGEVLRRNVIVGLANHTILIAKDGVERAIDDSGAPIRDMHGAIVGVVLVFRDVTTRRRVEIDQQHIVQFNDALGASLDMPTLLQALLQQFVPELSDICLVDLVQDDGSIRRAHLIALPDSQHAAQVQRLLEDPTVIDKMYQGLGTCTNDHSLLVRSLGDEVLSHVTSDAAHLGLFRSLNLASAIVVPLYARGQQLGLLTLVGVRPRPPYTQEDLHLAEELGRRAAIAFDNSLLYAQAQAAVRDREQFLSIAAHELRTPLTSLLGRAELMQRRVGLEHVVSERDLRSIQVVVDQSKRLNAMIATLLDLSRIQTGQFMMERVPLDLCALLHRLIEEFQSTLERHSLVYTESINAITVIGDEIRLEQAFVNLLQNAVKYSPDGDVIRVAVTTQANNVQVSISDEGIGIPAEALPNLFSRFYRAPNIVGGSISGMGIGLFVVKEIIDRHEGTVSVRSIQNEGSTFVITLPIASTD